MKYITLLLFLLPLLAQAQTGPGGCNPELRFYYDAAGNRIQRKEICNQGPPTARLEHQQVSLLVSPNPSVGRFFISLSAPMEAATFTLYDHRGRLVRSGSLPIEGIKINLSDQPDGVYALRVVAGADAWSENLLKR